MTRGVGVPSRYADGSYHRTYTPRPQPKSRFADYRETVGALNAAKAALTEAQREGKTPEELAPLITNIKALERAIEKQEDNLGGTMNYDTLAKANRALAEGLVPHLLALKELGETAEQYPKAFVQKRQAEILDAISEADIIASRTIRQYNAEAHQEARRLRAKADADIDPMTRVANELERQRLVASATTGDEFAQQAAEQLALGQPERASLLLSVAYDKGAKFASDTRVAVEKALDETNKTRAKARTIEEQADRAVVTFDEMRLKLLAKYGVGATPDGSAGRGDSGEAATASIRAKAIAFAKSQADGTDYVDPIAVEAS